MIRYLIKPMVALTAKWIDATVPVEQLHGLLIQGLHDFQHRHSLVGKDQVETQLAVELARARRLAIEAGVLSATDEMPAFAEEDRLPVLDEIHRWIESVPKGKVVTAKRLAAGTGKWLDRIECAAVDEHYGFLRDSMDSLLRHVEIRGTRCLQPLMPAASPDVQWIEKHDVAILFARSARRRRDLRLLNAALKLNDWAFPAHRKLPWGARSVRYLLALAEQEMAVSELMS